MMKNVAPTKKQLDFADEIADCLGIDFPNSSKDYNKASYAAFIARYAGEFYDKVMDDSYDEDFYDWINAYENDLWCEHY